MNESRSYSNESDRKDIIVKKDLKELKVITYINFFRDSIIKILNFRSNSSTRRLLLTVEKTIYNFVKRYTNLYQI